MTGIGYWVSLSKFDIDGDLIYSTIKNDLDALQEAIDYFINSI